MWRPLALSVVFSRDPSHQPSLFTVFFSGPPILFFFFFFLSAQPWFGPQPFFLFRTLRLRNSPLPPGLSPWFKDSQEWAPKFGNPGAVFFPWVPTQPPPLANSPTLSWFSHIFYQMPQTRPMILPVFLCFVSRPPQNFLFWPGMPSFAPWFLAFLVGSFLLPRVFNWVWVPCSPKLNPLRRPKATGPLFCCPLSCCNFFSGTHLWPNLVSNAPCWFYCPSFWDILELSISDKIGPRDS